MNLLSILLISLCVFYCGMIAALIAGTFRLRKCRGTDTPHVSVVVAARNEEARLGGCLDALIQQTWPADLYEVIIVDDRSTDRTPGIIREYTKCCPQIKSITIQKTSRDMAPKKHALQQGISKAAGDIILTTDADCRPQPGWIRAMTACFTGDVALTAGYSPLIHESTGSLLHRFIALEALGLACVAAGSFGLNSPLTCSGRNLAYRKSAFEAIGGFHAFGHFVSGDDDLLLHRMRKQDGFRFCYAVAPESVVPSIPAGSFTEFSHQRTRHASKGLHYDSGLKLGLIAVYLFYLLLFLSCFIPGLRPWGLTALILKMMFEFLLLFRMAAHFSQRRLMILYPVAALLHIPYVVLFGLRGQFGRFRWKGGHTSRKIEVDRS